MTTVTRRIRRTEELGPGYSVKIDAGQRDAMIGEQVVAEHDADLGNDLLLLLRVDVPARETDGERKRVGLCPLDLGNRRRLLSSGSDGGTRGILKERVDKLVALRIVRCYSREAHGATVAH